MELEQGDIVTLTHSLGELTNIYGTVVSWNHKPGSAVRSQMDAVQFKVLLFPISLFQELVPESIIVSETAKAFEGGWGLQSWGVTSWGGQVQL